MCIRDSRYEYSYNNPGEGGSNVQNYTGTVTRALDGYAAVSYTHLDVYKRQENTSGQLGDATTTQKNTPVQLQDFTEVNKISAGTSHSIAVKTDGTVWSWGLNSSGQLGDGTTTAKASPVQLSSISDVVKVSAGGTHSLALKTDGTVYGWGTNTNGQLGNGTMTNSSICLLYTS